MKVILSLFLLFLSFTTSLLALPHTQPVSACDTITTDQGIDPIIILPTIRVYGKQPYKPLTAAERDAYWRRVRDVKKVLPIARELTAVMLETYEYLETFDSERERRAHLDRVEADLVKEYKPRMKMLTLSQGLLLIKLMDRQTGSSSYDIVKAFYGGFAAGWYNMIARIYGGNLHKRYDPRHNEDDAVTERIIYLYDHGKL